MGLAPSALDLVRERADIVELIGERLQLTKKGTQFWACCPFHQEKTASFSVHPGRQIFKCFGCQVGGNIFGFLEKYERVSFPEAVRLVADRVGIELTEEKGERRRRRATPRRAAQLVRRRLPGGSAGWGSRRWAGTEPRPAAVISQ